MIKTLRLRAIGLSVFLSLTAKRKLHIIEVVAWNVGETNLNFDFGVRRRFSMCQRRSFVLSVSNGAETSVGGKREPLNVYGQTKYEGELEVERLKKHFIIRISWVFGVNGHNFIKMMLRLGKERGEVSVVDDQIGSPTYTYDLAKLCVDMIQTDKYGTYHATNQGYCSWYEFSCEIFKQAGMDVKVNPVDSAAFPAKAVRPKNSRMNQTELDRNGFERLPDWKDALARYLECLDK